MDTYQKLAFVANETLFESDGDLSPSATSVQLTQTTMSNFCGGLSFLRNPNPQPCSVFTNDLEIPIHMAAAPGGKRIPLLKSMLTTACEMDCYYCAFRAARNYRRVTFQPEELASVYMEVYQKRFVQGLFLSTGILAGGANTQNRILDTAEILRNRHKYRGYLHIKIMPGAEKGQVLRAMQLGDRVSINLEAPNAKRLAYLAPQKQFVDQLIAPFRWIDEIRSGMDPQSAWDSRWPSSTTQFVVGAAGETDLELLSTVQHLSRSTGFARAYFEAFNPVPNTPLEGHPPTDLLRQNRLYQASFLMRDYGYQMEDLLFNSQGNLPLERDPKLEYAIVNLRETPVELNRADRKALLQVPGIGPKGAEAIIRSRSVKGINDLGQIRKLGIITERAAPYILLNGKKAEAQLPLL
jgi:predicted DNA-binding helix-hairpin-helix protein